MGVNKFKSGTLFEIPLYGNYGFTYAKIVYFDKFDQCVVKPLNYFSYERFNGKIDMFDSIEYFSTPYLLLGEINVRGKDSWKYLGEIKLSADDFDVLKFKRCHRLFRDAIDARDLNWEVVRNFNPVDHYADSFENIKHLGFYHHCGTKYISKCLMAAWTLKNGIDGINYMESKGIEVPIDWDEYVYFEKMFRASPSDNLIFIKTIKKTPIQKPSIEEAMGNIYKKTPFFPAKTIKGKTKYTVKISPTEGMFFYHQFVKAGLEPSGYCWEGLIQQLLEKENSKLLQKIDFDPEADTFYAYCQDEKTMEELASFIHKWLSNTDKFSQTLELIDTSKLG